MKATIRTIQWVLILVASASTVLGGVCPPGQGPIQIQGRLNANIVCGKHPVLIKSSHVLPVYPAEASDRQIEARVVFQVVVKKDGNIGECKVLTEVPKNLGFAEAATVAVRQWRYVPANVGGEAVDSYSKVIVGFALD